MAGASRYADNGTFGAWIADAIGATFFDQRSERRCADGCDRAGGRYPRERLWVLLKLRCADAESEVNRAVNTEIKPVLDAGGIRLRKCRSDRKSMAIKLCGMATM